MTIFPYICQKSNVVYDESIPTYLKGICNYSFSEKMVRTNHVLKNEY